MGERRGDRADKGAVDELALLVSAARQVRAWGAPDVPMEHLSAVEGSAEGVMRLLVVHIVPRAVERHGVLGLPPRVVEALANLNEQFGQI